MQSLSSTAFTRNPVNGYIKCNTNVHDILNLVAYKADYDDRLTPSTDLQELRHDVHCLYDTWYPLNRKLNTLKENEDLIGIHLFLAKYPELDIFSSIISQFAINCYYTFISPESTPHSYTETYNAHVSLLMMVTASVFKNEGFYPDEPTIFESYPYVPWPPEISKTPNEVQHSGAPI